MISYLRLSRVPRRHLVADGLVGCPVRGHDVDVEICLRCRSLRGLAEKRPQYIVCEGAPSELPAAIAELVPPHGA